jgi:hypothetical protein
VTIDYIPTYGRPADFLRQYGFVPDADEEDGSVDSGSSGADGNGVRACVGSTNSEHEREYEREHERELLLEGAALSNRRKEFWRHYADMVSK